LIDDQRLQRILARTHPHARRRRRPNDHVVGLVIAMSLFARDSIPMAWRRLRRATDAPAPDDAAFTRARQRLGVAPVRDLFRAVAQPMARAGTPGAFYKTWRLMGIDGTTFDVPDTPDNQRVFGRGANQHAPDPFPQVRVLALCELGTHAICDFAPRPYRSSERDMVPHLLRSLTPDMLVLWDRGFFSFALIDAVCRRGCRLLARVQTSRLILARHADLPDGSYLPTIYPSQEDRRKERNGRAVRIIEYTHNDPTRVGYGVPNRLLTDVLEPSQLPAADAVALYHQRWEQALAFDEIKTHLSGRAVPQRSKRPGGVVQELYGLFLAHRVIRQVMVDAAAHGNRDPDRVPFTNSLRLVQCHLPDASGCSWEQWYQRLVLEVSTHVLRPRRNRWYPRVVKRRSKTWDKKRPQHQRPTQPSKAFVDSIVIT
jgi:hypothetical protein